MHMDMHSICTCTCIGCLHVHAHADAKACAKVRVKNIQEVQMCQGTCKGMDLCVLLSKYSACVIYNVICHMSHEQIEM